MEYFLFSFIGVFTLLFLLVFFAKVFGLYDAGKRTKTVSAIFTFNSKKYLIADIVDGDTIIAHVGKYDVPVRLIGVNAPESVHPSKNKECFGDESSAILREKVLNKYVRLIADKSQDDIDKYDRLLRYVYLEDGTNLNKWLIQNGYALEYTYKTAYKFQKEFKQAEVFARQNKKGLWGDKAFADYLAGLILDRIEKS